jgi:hypothetical protein
MICLSWITHKLLQLGGVAGKILKECTGDTDVLSNNYCKIEDVTVNLRHQGQASSGLQLVKNLRIYTHM